MSVSLVSVLVSQLVFVYVSVSVSAVCECACGGMMYVYMSMARSGIFHFCRVFWTSLIIVRYCMVLDFEVF